MKKLTIIIILSFIGCSKTMKKNTYGIVNRPNFNYKTKINNILPSRIIKKKIYNRLKHKSHILSKLIFYYLILKNLYLGKSLELNSTDYDSLVANLSPVQLNDPRGISISTNGILFVNDRGNNRVLKLTLNGFFISSLSYSDPSNTFLDLGLKPHNYILTTESLSFIVPAISGRVFDRLTGIVLDNLEFSPISDSSFTNSGIDIKSERIYIIGTEFFSNSTEVPSFNVYNSSNNNFLFSNYDIPTGTFFDVKIFEDIGYITYGRSMNGDFKVLQYDTLTNTFLSNFSINGNITACKGIEILNNCIFLALQNDTSGFVRILTLDGSFVFDFGSFSDPNYFATYSNLLYLSDPGANNIYRFRIKGKCPLPTMQPTMQPTIQPTLQPTISPTTSNPTLQPTVSPTTRNPTLQPTISPTTSNPTLQPTISPTTSNPTLQPTKSPTTSSPTLQPTRSPTTGNPTFRPTLSPTNRDPTLRPTVSPITNIPSIPTRIISTTSTSEVSTTTIFTFFTSTKEEIYPQCFELSYNYNDYNDYNDEIYLFETNKNDGNIVINNDYKFGYKNGLTNLGIFVLILLILPFTVILSRVIIKINNTNKIKKRKRKLQDI